MPSSRGSSPPRDKTHVSCLLHWRLGSLPLATPGSPKALTHVYKESYTDVHCGLFVITEKLQISQTFGMKYHETGKGKVQFDVFVI